MIVRLKISQDQVKDNIRYKIRIINNIKWNIR